MAKKKKSYKRLKPLHPSVLKLAHRIKAVRIKKGFTSQETFAYEKGVPRTLYAKFEKGQDLRFSSLVKVVEAFDMTLEEFFGEGF